MQTENRNLVNDEETLLNKLIAKYLPYWPFFVISILLGGIGAWAYLKTTVPIYEAHATLIIKDEKKGSEDSKLMESFDLISSKKIVENEIEVLQSRKLMKDVADKLNLYTPISQKHYRKTKSGFYSCPVTVVTPNPENLRKAESVPLSFDSERNEVILNNKDRYPLDSPIELSFGVLIFKKNKNYSEDSTNKPFFLSVYPPKLMVPWLLSGLKVESASKLSSVLNLSYRDEIPDRAEGILDQLIFSYRESEIIEKNTLAKNTLDFVNERIGLISKDLDTIQRKVQTYKSGSNAVDISTQGQLYLQNVSDNDQRLNDVNTRISVLNQVENYIQGGNSNGIIPSTLGVEDPVLSEMLNKLNVLKLDYEKGKVTIGENNPKLLEVKDQIKKLEPSILDNIKNQKRGLLTVRDNLSATNRKYSTILSQVPQKERQLIEITRDEQNKRSIYEFLLQKKEESELAYFATVADNKIVDGAQSGSSPVSPKRMIIYIGAMMLASIFSFGVITLKELFNRKVMYRRDIEALTSIPILGEVNNEKIANPIVIAAGERSLMAEQFRKLRLSLSFMGINEKHKKILMTSSISDEGKSFIAANLAVSLTLTGKRVIIVDMDLNRPTQAKIFDLDGSPGVADFLAGDKEPIDFIRLVPGYENLHIITAGNLPDNPTELISGKRTEELINYLNLVFDYVIIDTSPIGLVTDGYLLTDQCDATLFVVRHGYTPKLLIKRLDENIVINPVHNPAIIFNGVKQRGFIAAKYGYGYGYDYVYGYGKDKGYGYGKTTKKGKKVAT